MQAHGDGIGVITHERPEEKAKAQPADATVAAENRSADNIEESKRLDSVDHNYFKPAPDDVLAHIATTAATQAQAKSADKLPEPSALEQRLSSLELAADDLESKLCIEVEGPRWCHENVILQGHYEFRVQSCRTGVSKLHFLTERAVTEVDRRYSDFDLFRSALCCEYPGFFVPMLPPKETFLSFKQEDSDSLVQRKRGIKQFLSSLGRHP